MTIIEALKKENLRINNGSRWLVWNESFGGWYVYEQRPYKKRSTIIVATKNELLAVDKLLED